MKLSIKNLCAAGALLFFGCTAYAQTDPYHIKKTFHIASAGGWDYLAVNGNNLYVSHGDHVNILNKESGDSVGVIKNTDGVHGIAFVPALNRGFTSNGRLNTVTVFELSTNKILSQIATGLNPDAIMYDPYSKRIITCNGHSNNLNLIDPVTEKITGTIAVGGKPETAVGDGAGDLFVNIEDKNEIVKVNLKTDSVQERWSLAPAEGPTGLVLDVKNNILFAGCDRLLAEVDATNGKLIDKITIGDGCDGVAFDPQTRTVFASNGEGTLSVVQEQSARKYKVVQNMVSKKGRELLPLTSKRIWCICPQQNFRQLLRKESGLRWFPEPFRC